jgi:hypothetical protein
LILGCRGDGQPVAAAQAAPPPATEADFRYLDSPSMQFLPRLEEARGWRLENDPLVVPAAKLRDRIGLDADHFRAYNVIDATIGEYQSTDGRGFAVAEIFRFPDFIKAFGAYSTRRTATSTPMDIANEGYSGPRSVHVWRGPFYIRVIGGGSPTARQQLAALASAIADGMPPAPGRPAVFRFMPDAQRIANSETFTAQSAFGQPFFSNAFTAAFSVDGERVEALILPASSRAAATNLTNLYRNFFVMNGRLLDPVPNLGEGNFTAEDRFYGRTVAFRIDRFVIAYRGFVDANTLIGLAIATDQRILNSIRTQLQQEARAATQARAVRPPAAPSAGGPAAPPQQPAPTPAPPTDTATSTAGLPQ